MNSDRVERVQRVGLGLLVAAVAAIRLRVPPSVAGFGVPDSIEHLAIANAWVNGQGFVDPIQYFFFLDASPPLPAMAIRSPGVPALLALPIWAGLGVPTINALHAVYSGGVFLFVFAVATRFMRPIAAAIATVLLLLDPSWVLDATLPLTEVTALAVLMAIVAVAGRLDRWPGAGLAIVLCVVGWLVRPNVAVAVPVLGIAWLWKLGPREALRTKPLVGFLLGFGAVYLAVRGLVEATTGFAPYAGYGVLSQSLSSNDFSVYGRDFPGALAFYRENASAILSAYLDRVAGLWDVAFVGGHHLHLGFLAPVAAIHAVVRRRTISVERLTLVGLCAAFGVVVIANHVVLSAVRYPLFFVTFAAIAGIAALDEARDAPWLARFDRRIPQAIAIGVLLLLVGRVGQRAVRGHLVAREIREIREAAPAEERAPGPPPAIRSVCEHVEPDVLVATPSPWRVHAWCGHATIRIPSNLYREGVLEAFLEEFRPGAIQVRGDRLAGVPFLELLDEQEGKRLYRVKAPAPLAVWHAPPALACLGASRHCSIRDGRLRAPATDASRRMP